MQTTDVVPEALTSQMHNDDRLMKEKLTEMFPSIDIKLIEGAVHDSVELEEAVDILLNHVDDKRFTLFIFPLYLLKTCEFCHPISTDFFWNVN